MKLKDCKPKVRQVLQEVPEARNNDGVLIKEILIRHCKQYLVRDSHNEYFVSLDKMQYLPSFETIRRSRQIIQNVNGEFPPTDPAIIKQRHIKEKNWRDSEVREATKI